MKKILLFLSVLLCTAGFAQVKWYTLEEALRLQKQNPKKILIDFYADWCGPCKVMEKKTYNHPEIAPFLNEKYYPVKFDAEGNSTVEIYGRTFRNPDFANKRKRNAMHQFTQYLNVVAVPSIVFLDEQSNPITILQGALTAPELEPYLYFFEGDQHKKVKTREDWENYQKKFKSKIKD
ncbi:thioredoxin family protein [Chryseobacterium sp. MFBS3-17]|uniref:thioredoxin family protein n=1 Tax=Chryseobacterium sp. MFBS3-17 TaxID=2886689 RepID=UPI001D0F077D|nr:thioredoxin family protein [Chryseobacterium sp. MFBS3-17]MCC2590949.1 thioredoxin family protein [Chryseobacterium sp. MFBS3-17]